VTRRWPQSARGHFASAPLDRDWLRRQHDAGLPVVTDSGYLAAGDVAGLRNILDQAAGWDDVIAVLPLHMWWLDDRGGLPVLLERVQATGLPIGVVLEHGSNPFGVARPPQHRERLARA
jgi:hypothetical protein